jgi:acetyl-CoA acetyltransferase
MSSVFVIGVGMTQFARHRERLLEDLAREAVRTAVQSTQPNVDLPTRWYEAPDKWICGRRNFQGPLPLVAATG